MTKLSPLSVFLLCACGFAGLLLTQAPYQLKWISNASSHTQPGFWSVLSLSGMIVFAVSGFFAHRKNLNTDSDRRTNVWQSHLLPIEYALYFMVYVALVSWLGYLPATLLVFPLMVFRAGYRQRHMFVISILTGIAIVLLFKTLLQVKIPGGELYNLFPDSMRNFLILNF